MKPSKALTINKHEAQLRVYGDIILEPNLRTTNHTFFIKR
jgi:hypothetical protein